MRLHRLATTVTVVGIALITVAGSSAATVSVPTGIAPAGVSAEAKRSATIPCTTPRGEKATFSWGPPARTTVGIAYRNPCTHTVKATLRLKARNGRVKVPCYGFAAERRGVLKIAGYSLTKLTRGC
ncbi:hypothetical protein SAMN05421505_101309 [Sinosporangium album]|uniref:Ig-like domain-containing protein n=1 Tax=Sinosporangium album TaxID=504805 RepID=A0A1G7R904_9ACTN|nr:hypothetical protein [Sinosporangium album]SDG07258.1 hypothetical protein SAMN05421505_101309 [Sinosporangium album]